jgi:hypothetical protein
MILLCMMKRTHGYSGLCDSVGAQDLNFVFLYACILYRGKNCLNWLENVL